MKTTEPHTPFTGQTRLFLRLTPNSGQVVGWSGCQRELAAFVL